MTAPLDRAYVEILPLFKGFNEKLKSEVQASVGSVGTDLEKVSTQVGTTTEKMAKHTEGLFSSVKESARSMFIMMAPMAAGFGAIEFIKGAVAAAGDAARLNRQTAAVIKSTGMAAHVTAQQVGEYADKLSAQTGITKDVIQDNENLLLTFTNVQNRVGKGNDIFDQATKAVLNMSVALKEDGKSASIQLGKALNDPIKGITALSRVGVAFTEQQKEQIKTMVKSGDTLGAQKIILAELDKEFGNSAVAQSSMGAKMKAAYHEVEVAVGTKLLPVMKVFSTFMVTQALPAFMKMFDAASSGEGALGSIVRTIGQVLRVIVTLVTNGIRVLAAAWKALNPAIEEFARFLESTVLPAVSKFATELGSDLTRAINTANGFVSQHKVLVQSLGVAFITAYASIKLYNAAVSLSIIVQNAAKVAAAGWAAVMGAIAWAQLLSSVRSFRDLWAALSLAMNANWIAIVVIAIAALVAGLIYAYKHSKTFRDIVDEIGRIAVRVGKDIVHFFVAMYNTVKPVFEAIGKGALWLWHNAIEPVFRFIRDHWKLVLLVLLPGVALIIMNWDRIKSAAMFLWNNVLKPTWAAMKLEWSALATAIGFTWNNILKPTWNAIATVALWLWHNVLYPAWTGIRAIIQAVVVAVQIAMKIIQVEWKGLSIVALWLWHNILYPAWTAIRAVIEIVSVAIQIAMKIVQMEWKGLSIVALWLWHTIIEPVWRGIKQAIELAIAGARLEIQGLITFWQRVLFPAIMWLWHTVFEPVWNGIKLVVRVAAADIRIVIETLIAFWQRVLAPAAMWLWHTIIEPVWHGILSVIKGVWENGIRPAFNALSDFVSRIIPDKFRQGVQVIESWWNTLRHIASVPVSFIIDTVVNKGIIDTINSIASFFGVPGRVQHVANPVAKFEEGGQIPGPMSEKDNKLAWVATGEHIMPTKRTRKWLPTLESIRLHDRLPDSIPHYDMGGLITDAAGWVRDRIHLGDITSRFHGPFVSAIAGAPAMAVGQLITWAKGLVSKLKSDFGSFLGSAARSLFGGSSNVMMGKSVGGRAATGQLLAWIQTAEALTGVGSSWTNPLTTLIMRESGGNPNSINLTDSNARRGDPSRGLMQTIMATFQHYRLASLPNNIYDPVANIVAGIRYILARYGTIFNVQQANANLPPKGYATGAWNIPSNQLAYLHAREMVVPAQAADAIRARARRGDEVPDLLRALIAAVEKVAPGVGSEINGTGRAVIRRARSA